MFNYKYHSIKTVADMLPDKRTTDWVIKQLVDPDRDTDGHIIIWISPHYCPSQPIELLDYNTQKLVLVDPSPILVENLQHGCKFDEKGIYFDEANEDLLLSDEFGNDYLPTPTLFIPYTSLRLRTDEFDSLVEQVERSQEALSQVINYKTDSESTPFDPNEYIDNCLAKGMASLEIVYKLVTEHGTKKEKYHGLLARKLGEFPELHVANATWRQRGLRMFKKASSIYADK